MGLSMVWANHIFLEQERSPSYYNKNHLFLATKDPYLQ